MWTMKYSDMHSDVDWKKVFRDNFLSSIKFHKIPANVLMKEVDPLKVVPNDIIVTALAYQVYYSFSILTNFTLYCKSFLKEKRLFPFYTIYSFTVYLNARMK